MRAQRALSRCVNKRLTSHLFIFRDARGERRQPTRVGPQRSSAHAARMRWAAYSSDHLARERARPPLHRSPDFNMWFWIGALPPSWAVLGIGHCYFTSTFPFLTALIFDLFRRREGRSVPAAACGAIFTPRRSVGPASSRLSKSWV